MEFITYWIPLTNTIDFEKIFEENVKYSEKKVNFEEKDISDELEDKPNILRLNFLSNRNFVIKLQDKTYLLEYESSKCNGILIYKHNIKENHILAILDIQIYDLLKRFFHEHESHDKEEDSLLIGLQSEKILSDKEIIIYYSEQFTDKFQTRYETIMLQSPDIIWSINENRHRGVSVIQAIDLILDKQKDIHKVQIELQYFHFLFNNLEEGDKKCFFLIEYQKNINKFIILYQKYEIANKKFDTKYTSIINIWQFIVAGVGVLIGLIIGFYGIHLTNKGLLSKDFNESYNILYEKNIEIDKKIDINHQILSESNKQLDAFYNNNSKEHNSIDKIVTENKSLLINQNEKMDLYYDSSFKQSINIEKKVDENNILIIQKVNKNKSIK